MPETTARKCFYIPTDAHVEGKGFVPSLVTEGEAGHAPLVGSGPFAEPWYWGDTYEEACEHAAKENKRLGLTPDDVSVIVLSSMAATTDRTVDRAATDKTLDRIYSKLNWDVDPDVN